MKKKHSAIIRKREAEVADRLSPSWNGQDSKPVLSPDGISYEVSDKNHAVSYGGLGLLQQIVKWSGLGRAIVLAIIGKRIFLDFRRPATGHANLVSGVGSAEMDRSSG